MSRCPNKNTAEYKALLSEFGSMIKVNNLIINYQDANNTEDIPSVVDVRNYLRSRRSFIKSQKQDFKAHIENNIIRLGIGVRTNEGVYLYKSEDPDTAINNLQRAKRFLESNNIAYGGQNAVQFLELDNTYLLRIDEDNLSVDDSSLKNLDSSRGRVISIINHFAKIFPNLDIQILNQTEAARLYDNLPSKQKADVPFSDVKSFYYNGVAYIIPNRITPTVTAEELLHPFVNALKQDNQTLFNGLLSEAITSFPSLKEEVDKNYSDTKGFEQTDRDFEIVTKALSRHFDKEFTPVEGETKTTSGFRAKVKELLDWLANIVKDLHKFITGKTLNISAEDISQNATLSDVAKLLTIQDVKLSVEPLEDNKIQYALDPKLSKVLEYAIEKAERNGFNGDLQKEMIMHISRAMADPDSPLTKLFSANKNPLLFGDPDTHVVMDEPTHTYYDTAEGEEFYSTTTAIKGKFLNEEDRKVNLTIGNDFDSILNAVLSDTLVDDIETEILNEEEVRKIYIDLQERIEYLEADGSVAIPQVVLFNDQEIKVSVFDSFDKNGKPKTDDEGKPIMKEVTYKGLAGTADVLFITPDGKFKILDLKTSQHFLKTDQDRYNRAYDLQEDSLILQKGGKEKLSTRGQHNLQIALYARMLENMGYTMSDSRDALSTFHIRVKIDKAEDGSLKWGGEYTVEGISVHQDSEMQDVVDKIMPETLSNEQREIINNRRSQSSEYNFVQEENLTAEEAASEEQELTQGELQVYLGALRGYSKGLIKRKESLEKIKGGAGLRMSKEATIDSINDTLTSIEISYGEGGQAIKSEFTRVIRDGIANTQEYIDYILDPANFKKPEYINYVLNFERYSIAFNSLIDLSNTNNSVLSKTQANLILNLKTKLERLKGTESAPGLIDAAIFNFVKETVKSVSSAEFNEADLKEILTTVRDMTSLEFSTGDLATSKDTLLAVLDKIYKAKEQEFLDRVQSEETMIRMRAGKLAKLNPDVKLEDLYDFMHEFDKDGLPTGFIVQKLGPKYYDKIREIRAKFFDANGNIKEYRDISDLDQATPEDIKWNKELYILKQESRKFWRAEFANDDGKIVDGDYHEYTSEYKKARARVESPIVLENGSVVWRKKRGVSEKNFFAFRNRYGQYRKVYFAQKIEGVFTGVVNSEEIWVPHRKYVKPKEEVIENGKKVSMINPRYNQIMNPTPGDALAQAQKEFYEFYVSHMNKLLEMLPPDQMDSMVGRIPTIMQSKIANKVKKEGPLFAKMYARMAKGFKDYVSETGSFRRVVTNEKGEIVNTLPIYFTGSLKADDDLEIVEKKIEDLKTQRKNKDISTKDYEKQYSLLISERNALYKAPTKSTVSKDLGSGLLKFNAMAHRFQAMSEIEDIVTAFIRQSDAREVLESNFLNETVQAGIDRVVSGVKKYSPVGKRQDQEEPKIKRRLKKWARMVFYDNERVTRGFLEKASNDLMQYGSFAYVATNPFGNINNLAIGRLNNTIELIGGRYFKRKAYLQMKKEFNREQVLNKQMQRLGSITSSNKKGAYDPKKPMTKVEGWVDLLRMMDSKTEIREFGADSKKESYFARYTNWAYLLNDSFEYNVQSQIGLAMVASHTAIDEGGNELNLYDASIWDNENQRIIIDPKYKVYDINGKQVDFNREYMHKLHGQIRAVNIKVHGSYARADRMVIQSELLGKLAIQFKKWVLPSIKSRFRKEYYDENLGWVEGRWRSAIKFFAYAFQNIGQGADLAKNWQKELIEDFENESEINYGHLEQRARNKVLNTYTFFGEIGMVLLTWIMSEFFGNVLSIDDDDSDIEKKIKNIVKYNTDRAHKELLAFIPVFGSAQAWQLIKNPIASAGILRHFTEAVYSTVSTGYGKLTLSDKEFYADPDYTYQRGDKKGDYKMAKEWQDFLPFLYTIKRWNNFTEEREFYVD